MNHIACYAKSDTDIMRSGSGSSSAKSVQIHVSKNKLGELLRIIQLHVDSKHQQPKWFQLPTAYFDYLTRPTVRGK